MMIEVKNLKRQFVTYERGSSFKEVFSTLFSRKEKIVHALKGISFNVDEGELIGFLGPNGAGKSTTLKILSGILYPSSGEVSVMGYVPWSERKKYVSKIGAVFGQKSQLYFDIPPIDAFYLNKAIFNIPDNVFKANMNDMIELFGVQNIVKKPTRQLSLGERMKCEFIMSMLHGPKIIFLDEPTIGLDVIAKQSIREIIKELNRKGVTFILTTHDLGDIEHLANRVIIINNGDIVFDNTMVKLKKHFGVKKQITLSTKGILPDLNIPGVNMINKASDYEAEIELDYDILNLDSFISHINKKVPINDMSIKDLPIEKIIMDFYSGSVEK